MSYVFTSRVYEHSDNAPVGASNSSDCCVCDCRGAPHVMIAPHLWLEVVSICVLSHTNQDNDRRRGGTEGVRKGRGSEEGKEEVAGVRRTSPAVLTDWTWKEMSEWVGGRPMEE